MPASVPTGTRIRERRVNLGRKQAALASQVGISGSYLNLIEHNRRPIGGALLLRLADALGVELATLSEDEDASLAESVRAAGAAQGLPDEELAAATDLTRRNPAWARVIAAQAEALEAQSRTIEALSDRLTHDPTLAEAMHELLSAVSVVRSTASILAQTPEIDPNWLGRFHQNLDTDSRRLASGAEAVVGYLDQVAARGDARLLPSETVARFMDAHDHAFDALEERGAAAIPEIVADLADPEARALAVALLTADAEDAARLPKDAVLQASDPDDLLDLADGDFALVLRRMALVGQGRGLIVCDAAGALIRRKPVAGFSLPIMGAGCPLWPVYRALSQPGQPIVGHIQTPDGAGWTAHAISTPIGRARFGHVPSLAATMMITRAAVASPTAEPVGPGCRVCPRGSCTARREPSVLSDRALGVDMEAVTGDSSAQT